MTDLQVALSSVLVFAISAYVLLDGFDLGVGMWIISARQYEERTQIVNSIAPVWDGNETWLVLAGATLLGGFSLAYGNLLPALYVPLILMLLALGLRGVSFEFRFQVHRNRQVWDRAFVAGSAVAALCQGAIAGALLSGIAVSDQQFSGSSMDWLTPVSCTMALLVTCGYLIVAAGWLDIKTDGELRARVRRHLAIPLTLLPLLVALVLLLTQGHFDPVAISPQRELLRRWIDVCALLVYATLWMAKGWAKEGWIFALGLALVAFGLLHFVSLIYPWIVPYSVTIADASSPAISQRIIFLGALLIIPVILVYCLFAYHIFRGKAPREEF